MLENFSLDAFILYLETHPLVAVLLVVIAVMFLGSLIRKLVKVALLLAVVFLVGLYLTHREAEEDWRMQTELMKQKAAELGKDVLEKGKRLLEEGRKELEIQLDKE
jgi:c-di-AMP phosphodiesterase-like protein